MQGCELQADKLKAAQPHFDATWAKFEEAIDQLPEEEKGKKLKPVQVLLIFHKTHHKQTAAPLSLYV